MLVGVDNDDKPKSLLLAYKSEFWRLLTLNHKIILILRTFFMNIHLDSFLYMDCSMEGVGDGGDGGGGY